jgi:hypothetical protein
VPHPDTMNVKQRVEVIFEAADCGRVFAPVGDNTLGSGRFGHSMRLSRP